MLDLGRCTLFEKLGFDKEKNFGYTEDEQIVLYSMRAFLSSPIQISETLEDVDDFRLSVYCNEEIIDINQDSEFSTAIPVTIIEKDKTVIHVYKKKLSGGDTAYAIFNLGESCERVNIYLDSTSSVRDVWAKRDLDATAKISLEAMPHTVRILRCSEL